MIDILMEDHRNEYGGVLTKNNIKFNEQVLCKLVSLYLGACASASRMGEYHETKQYLEKYKKIDLDEVDVLIICLFCRKKSSFACKKCRFDVY